MASEVTVKRAKMDTVKIGTHNGHFHADEALAVYMLRLLPQYASAGLVRSRDPAVLDTCHTVVDVGGVYDDGKFRYDHHQREFSTNFPGHYTKLSSAGLVYMHYGKAIIAQHTQLPIDHPDVELLYQKLYTDFVEAIDANDNGVSKYDTSQLEQAGIEEKFKSSGITLPAMVGDLNHEDPLNPGISRNTADDPQAEEDYRFGQASALMGNAFLRKMHGAATAWLPARSIVQTAFDNRDKQQLSGRVLILPRAGIPWKEHLYDIEQANNLPEDQKILYCLYPEKEDPESKWRIQCVSKDMTSFVNRKSLPEKWRGVRDAELDALLGDEVPNGAVFVHAAGFIGGHTTEAGARAMVLKALAE